ncbi:hypothetical protein [Rathayibacter sp. VKM Ac-2927]|uniref:hypothetical protein n=1 Tax=Rathayibacter sp. VKM Ac-2927 TaxID=2929478 RepID=UPI001FB33B07|nr:hypothetical protein [Rathayibacter sp. VKM Ac-2927]MCJ1688523.1 hypothetical protein [Rathayibacter sp. VKM Ac-2927]
MDLLAPTRGFARLYVCCAVLLTVTYLIDVLFAHAWWSLGGVLVFGAASYRTSHHLTTLSAPRHDHQLPPTSEHNKP